MQTRNQISQLIVYELCFYRAVEKKGQGGGGAAPIPPPHQFQEQKFFLHVKTENTKFLHVNNICDFSLFIKQDINDKK